MAGMLGVIACVVLYEEAKGVQPQIKLATTAECRLVPDERNSPLICSHKGYHKAYNAPKGHHLFPPMQGYGLARSMTWMASQMGVRCFDLDLSVTSDGAVMVGHPADLKKLLQLRKPFSAYSLAEIQRRAEKNTLPVEELFDVVEKLGLVQMTLEPKNFTAAQLKETAALLGKKRSLFKRGGAGLYMIVDEAAVDAPSRKELAAFVPLAVGVRQAEYGGDHSRYCDTHTLPSDVSMVMPSYEVVASCPDTHGLAKTRVSMWNVGTRGDAVHLGARASAIITDYPAVVAEHCGAVHWPVVQ